MYCDSHMVTIATVICSAGWQGRRECTVTGHMVTIATVICSSPMDWSSQVLQLAREEGMYSVQLVGSLVPPWHCVWCFERPVKQLKL